MKKNFLVSVAMPNYGQEEFISEAILGVLSQETDFEVELIVAEDCSPDSTESVVKDIIANHPNGHWIKYTRHIQNKGAIPNFAWSIGQAKGKYIAICEGDDYWTDPLKLQKQVEFLENNPDYSLTFHKIQPLGSDLNEFSTFNNPEYEQDCSIEDLAKGNFIHTPSVVFRKNFEELPSWINYCPIGDYPLHMYNASFGSIKYFPDKMAVYRIGSGIWSSKSLVYQILNIMFTLKFLISHFKNNKKVFENLNNQFNNHYLAIVKSFDSQNKPDPRLKDYEFLESITNFRGLLKIMKIKLLKKIKIK